MHTHSAAVGAAADGSNRLSSPGGLARANAKADRRATPPPRGVGPDGTGRGEEFLPAFIFRFYPGCLWIESWPYFDSGHRGRRPVRQVDRQHGARKIGIEFVRDVEKSSV